MTFTLEQLPWLVPAPTDILDRLRHIVESDQDSSIASLRTLATTALNTNQLSMVARTVTELKGKLESLSPLRPVRLAIIGETTTSFFPSAMVASGVRHGLDISVVEAPFNQVIQESISPNSTISQERPDVVLLMVGMQTLGLGQKPITEDGEAAVSEAISQITRLRDSIRQNTGATVIIPTIPKPRDSLFGNLEAGQPGSIAWSVDQYNSALGMWLSKEPDLLLDLAGLANNLGLSAWHDERLWHLAKVPFADRFIPIFGDHVARVLAAHAGLARRVLVLDLDNTLWGGVIGDDGLEGIIIGQGDPVGEAYTAFQATLRLLKERGIVLTACSKNEDSIAREPFRQHPDMLLKEKDFSVFQANWTDKPSNIKAIAEKLSLGLDALVFVDDNPVERAHVRETLPQVAVPELPSDPALFTPTLLAAGYFETTAISHEDAERANYYQANAQRAELLHEIGSTEDFLQSLDMTSQFRAADDLSIKRIAQLVNKSNQFNLTTQRHDEMALREFAETPGHSLLSARLRDKFGDNGIVSVIHLAPNKNSLEFETWVMSCRVLGRSLEEAVLEVAVRIARAQGAQDLRGFYLPTERNALVKGLYARLGFAPVSLDPVREEWSLRLEDYVEPSLPMQIEIYNGLVG